jgi:hypothetical protein
MAASRLSLTCPSPTVRFAPNDRPNHLAMAQLQQIPAHDPQERQIFHRSWCSQSIDWAYTSPRVEVCAKETSPDEQSNGSSANCFGTGWVVLRNPGEQPTAAQLGRSSRTGCGRCRWQRPDALLPPQSLRPIVPRKLNS